MRFTSLGSGSKGNATLVQSQETLIMIDCGFGLKEAEARLKARGIRPEQLSAILVTHEHGDHLKGAPMLARRYEVPLYATPGTARSFDRPVPQFRPINVHQRFSLGDLTIQPVTVPHDAREPSQFVIHCGPCRLGVLTDLGSITPLVIDAYRHCDAVLLECNHDVQMLAEGPYPPSLKRRVGGQWGHLSNEQAAQLLSQIATERLQHLLVSHISDKNNHPEIALSALASVLEHSDCDPEITVLSQEDGSPWLQLQPNALVQSDIPDESHYPVIEVR
ncbi:MAG: MBL fold metallo-hydrolase [Saccharospirillum sp.]|nr:MBL fold metallo-hydrolase [Saccharospirillum sp.]